MSLTPISTGRPSPLQLYVTWPSASRDTRYPCYVYCHGGGMAVQTADMYTPLLQHMAQHGLVVVAPDFTNSSAAAFPAGLEDCYATVKWVTEHTDTLGITSQIVVGGESGGGNLSIATALLAKERGLAGLRGLFTLCPFIGGPVDAYGELNGYGIDSSAALAYQLYIADGVDDDRRHVALPHFATVEQLRGLVPTVVTVNEFDPLKHEGLIHMDVVLSMLMCLCRHCVPPQMCGCWSGCTSGHQRRHHARRRYDVGCRAGHCD